MYSIVSGFSLPLPSQPQVLNFIYFYTLLNQVVMTGAVLLEKSLPVAYYSPIFILSDEGSGEVRCISLA